MQQLSEKTKDEIKNLISIALMPINGRVKSFGEQYQVVNFAGNGSRRVMQNWNDYPYPILIESSIGEISTSLDSQFMPNSWDMVEVAIRLKFLGSNSKISPEISKQIANILYSDYFLSLNNNH